MINKASGRSALILAAGLLVLPASPAMATTDGDNSTAGATSVSQAAPVIHHRTFRHAWHHRKHYAHRRLRAIAKAGDDDKAATPAAAASDNKGLATIPPSIANANAQMLLAGAQVNAAAAIPPGTDNPATLFETADAAKETVVAASDQLSDSDRTLQEGSSATATASAPPAPEPAATITGESSAWDQTSLIGRIFIGFGALLTMASAARMFIT
jgi:hypothetical protein